MQTVIKTLIKKNVETDIEFDIYSCENEHLLIIERKPSWKDQVKVMVGCSVCKAITEYRTTVKEPDLPEAIQRFIVERKGKV
jgi:hypothetical protein